MMGLGWVCRARFWPSRRKSFLGHEMAPSSRRRPLGGTFLALGQVPTSAEPKGSLKRAASGRASKETGQTGKRLGLH